MLKDAEEKIEKAGSDLSGNGDAGDASDLAKEMRELAEEVSSIKSAFITCYKSGSRRVDVVISLR